MICLDFYETSSKIYTLTTVVKLYNVQAACYLCSTNKILPDWGKKQHEVGKCTIFQHRFYWYEFLLFICS